jgi:hypothetical protein
VHILYNNLVVQKKKVNPMKFVSITELGDHPDIQLRFEHKEKPITTTITVFPAPQGVVGPKVIPDKDGKLTIKDGGRHALDIVVECSEGSKAFVEEFVKTAEFIEETFGLKLSRYERKPAMISFGGDLENLPVAYVATFRGPGGFRNPQYKNSPWLWEFRLYAFGNYYVKIHTDGPCDADTFLAGTLVNACIKWGDYRMGKLVKPKQNQTPDKADDLDIQ